MASNNKSYLDSWQASEKDLASTAQRKAPKSSHIKLLDNAQKKFPTECGPVQCERVRVPEGLELSDVPFSFTDSGVASSDRRAVAVADWREDIKKASEKLARAFAMVARAEKLASLHAPTGKRKRYAQHIADWLEHENKKASLALDAAQDAVSRLALDRYYSFKKIAKAGRAGADAWALVNPDLVRGWLADFVAPAFDLACPLASPFNPLYVPKLSDSDRERLRAAREEAREKREEVLLQIAKNMNCDIASLPKIWHDIAVGAPADGALTDTGKAVLVAQVRRWGVQALDGPIKRSGAPYLLALRDQQYEIKSREEASDQAFNALIGGPVRGAVPGAPDGSGGKRYKISVKGTQATGGARIIYRMRKKKNNLGGFSDTEFPLIEKQARKASEEALNQSVLGRSFTELDAIINSCYCPSIAEGARAEKKRVERSLMACINRECYGLDDVSRTYFWRRAAVGASREMCMERGEEARAKYSGVQLVSLEALEQDVQEKGCADVVGAEGLDCPELVLDRLCVIARAAAGRGKGTADNMERCLRLLAEGYTQKEVAKKLGVVQSVINDWYHKILRACREEGADAPLAL